MESKNEIAINSININKKTDFPYLVLDVVNDTPSRRNPGFHVMHWHEDIQFIYVSDGSVEVLSLDSGETIKAGEALFINSNVIHHVKRVGNCHYFSFIFPAYFLKFYTGSPTASLVDAITSDTNLKLFHFYPAVSWQNELIQKLQELACLEQEKDTRFYSYEVLLTLSSIWLLVSKNMQASADIRNDRASSRVRRVLRFLSEHYAEDLTLLDLAESAHISKSECTRCFQKCLHTTHINIFWNIGCQRQQNFCAIPT